MAYGLIGLGGSWGQYGQSAAGTGLVREDEARRAEIRRDIDCRLNQFDPAAAQAALTARPKINVGKNDRSVSRVFFSDYQTAYESLRKHLEYED